MKFELPQLPYEYDALEGVIDATTMEIHHSKHHAGYVNKLNELLEQHGVASMSIEELLAHISDYPTGIRNNAGGHYNHSLFWEQLSGEEQEIPEELADKLQKQFGSFEKFKEEFTNAALSRFGSGWAWLALTPTGEFKIFSTANQDNPLMDIVIDQEGEYMPVLALDVWEHAYYLSYQNRRAEYVEAFWQIINWEVVNTRVKQILG